MDAAQRTETRRTTSKQRKNEKEYEPPKTEKPPPPPKCNAPRAVMEKQVEPARWVMALGSAFMTAVFGLAMLSSFLPWWIDAAEVGGDQLVNEATIWVIKTTTTLQAKEEEHFGCDSSCDQTRVIANKISSKEQTWDDTCRRAQSNMQETCNRINILRGFLGFAVLSAFCYILPGCISFTGSDNRSHMRFSPVVGIILGCISFICLLAALITGIAVNGKVPYAGDEGEDRSQKLNGEGFHVFLSALAITVPAILLTIASQVVATQFERAPFGWDDEDRPQLKTWKSEFAAAPTTLPPAVQLNAWEEPPDLV